MAEDDDEPFDYDAPFSQEEENEMLHRVMGYHGSTPGNFHCFKCYTHFLDRLDKSDERYFKAHGLKREDMYGPDDDELSTKDTSFLADTSTDTASTKEKEPMAAAATSKKKEDTFPRKGR